MGERRTEEATLGGGCFWCLEAAFDELEGVEEVVPGYAGGRVPDPTYRQVCGGGTGHAEVVRVRFDPEVISYRELLEVFFTLHDPTTRDRQGADVGPQYRSIILHHSGEQEAEARRLIGEMEEEGRWEAPIVTGVEPLEAFYPAEEEHRDYYRKHPERAYCRVVIRPKLSTLERAFPERMQAARDG